MPNELPDPGKSVAALETELRSAIAERATAADIRELRKEIADLKAANQAKQDAAAAVNEDDDDVEHFPSLDD